MPIPVLYGTPVGRTETVVVDELQPVGSSVVQSSFIASLGPRIRRSPSLLGVSWDMEFGCS